MQLALLYVILIHMADRPSPWSGPSHPDPAQPDHRPGAEPTPHPQYEFAGAPGQYPDYSGPAGSQSQYGTPGYQYAAPAYGTPPLPGEQPSPRRNTVGIIALVVAVLGAIFSVVHGWAALGWILLPFGFILGLVGLFMSGRSKKTAIAAVIVSIVGTIMAMAFFASVVGSAVDEAFGSEDVTVSQSGSTDSDGSADAVAAAADIGDDQVGTRNNPAAIGDVLSAGDWEVVVNSFTRNATVQVMAANMFNDPPPADSQYALVNLTATYVGEGSGHADFLSTAFVTDAGNVVRSYDHPVVTPDPLEGELYNGASATGNIDFAIPEGESGLLRLELETFGDEVFVAVE